MAVTRLTLSRKPAIPDVRQLPDGSVDSRNLQNAIDAIRRRLEASEEVILSVYNNVVSVNSTVTTMAGASIDTSNLATKTGQQQLLQALGDVTTQEDTPSVDGQKGLAVMAVANEALADLVSNDGDETRIATDKKGRMLLSGAISGTFIPADNHNEDAPHVSGDTGSFILGVRNDADAVLTSANGDYSAFAVDSAGRVKIRLLTVNDQATVFQGGAWSVGRTWNLAPGSDGVTAFQGGSWSTGRTWNLSSGSDSVAAVQSGSWSVSQAGSWTVAATQSGAWTTGRTWNLASGSDSVSAVQSGTWTVNQGGAWSTGRTWNLASGTDSVAAVQSGTWTTARSWNLTFAGDKADVSGSSVSVTNFPAIQAVSQSGAWTVAATQSGAWSTGRTWNLASGSDSVTAVQGTSPWVTNDPGLPDTLGTKTSAGSTSVTMASDLVDADGGVKVHIQNGVYAEDSASADGQSLVAVGWVRNDTAAVKTSADGDYTTPAADSAGRPLVKADTPGTVTDGGIVTVTNATTALIAVSTSLRMRVVMVVIPASTATGVAQPLGVHLNFGANAAVTNGYYPPGVYTFVTNQAINAIRPTAAVGNVSVTVASWFATT